MSLLVSYGICMYIMYVLYGYVYAHIVCMYIRIYSMWRRDDGVVTAIRYMSEADKRINGGFMFLRSEIFDYINEGEELVEEPFQRLIQDGLLFGYRHEGFWKAMDTFKDKITYERMDGQSDRPWAVWES